MPVLVRLLAVLAVLVGAGVPAGPAGAATFGPPRTVAAPSCARSGGGSTTDAAFGGGTLRAWTSFPACGAAITHATGGSQGWVRTATPYRGVVLATAADAVASYLLYVVWDAQGRATGLGVTKRTHDGRFYPTTLLSRAAARQVVATSGDIAAHGGRWWAVWTEQVGPGGEFAHEQLFQAGTYGTPRGRTQLTSTAPDVADTEPALALDANGAVLAWSRQTRPAQPGPSDLWVAVSRNGALERARAFSTQGNANDRPDVQRIAGVTYLAWVRDGRVVEADNGTGTFRSHQFLVPGDGPRVSASAGSSFVAWTAGTQTDSSYRVLYARGSKGGVAFDSAYLSGFGESLGALVAAGGRATVLVHGRSGVYSRTGG